ncbi:MAG: hypothetical protein WBD47_10680 [Phormidesmis sp.]
MVSIQPITNRRRRPVAKASGRHSFQLDQVYCIDETGGNWITERGEDDIYLGGVAISTTGATKIPYFKVGGFDDRDKKTYRPSRQFTAFSQSVPSAVILVLVEKDSGKQMQGFLDDLVKQNQTMLVKAANQAKKNVGAGAGESDLESEIWAMVIKEGLKLAKDVFVSWYKSARKDDIFEPKLVAYSRSSAVRVVRFKGHDATYDISYHWAS